jgi:hypothetical protein
MCCKDLGNWVFSEKNQDWGVIGIALRKYIKTIAEGSMYTNFYILNTDVLTLMRSAITFQYNLMSANFSVASTSLVPVLAKTALNLSTFLNIPRLFFASVHKV